MNLDIVFKNALYSCFRSAANPHLAVWYSLFPCAMRAPMVDMVRYLSILGAAKNAMSI